MIMTEVFDKLKSLQKILAEKYEIQAKIEDSPKQLVTQDELLARTRKEFLETNAAYEQVKAAVEKLKKDLSEAESTRESGEKSMDNITTHREYEALDRQIETAKGKEAAARKELQKKEKELAELNDTLRQKDEDIQFQEAELKNRKGSIEKNIEEYNRQLEQLSAQEAEITPSLDSETVYKFQRIIQRNSEGIVAVKNGVCTGCHMILPAQFSNEVRAREKILFCPYCSRILFYQEVEAGEEEDYSSLEETGSLGDLDDEFEDELDDEDDLLLDDQSDITSDLDDEKTINFEE